MLKVSYGKIFGIFIGNIKKMIKIGFQILIQKMMMKSKNHRHQFEVQDAVRPEIFKVKMSPNPQIMNPSLPHL